MEFFRCILLLFHHFHNNRLRGPDAKYRGRRYLQLFICTLSYDNCDADKGFYMIICTVYIFLGLAFTSTIIEIVRRQMVENLRRMQELRAQIKAQVKLAETLKKLSDNAGM